MSRLGRVVAAGVGVVALAALAWHGVRRVEAGSGEAESGEARDRAGLTALSAGGQAAGQLGGPTIEVYSRETVVDVTVVDKDGKPVHGLAQADFSVMEDGKAQAVRSFTETRRDAVGAAAIPAVMPMLPPHVYTNRQPDPATGASNIILLDPLNVAPGDQMYSRQEAAKYVKAMPPGTQVALFGLGDPLRILQGFTSDPGVLIAAMNDKKNSLLPPASAMGYCMPPKLTLDALGEIAAFVSGIKGRKNLIWFVGGGIPLSDPCDPDLARETFDMLAAAQVAIYPVDARGLVNPSAINVTSQLSGISAKTGPAAAAGTMGALIGFANQLLAYEALAERTGGVAYYNSRDVAGEIGKAIDNGANYYTLSYVPPGLAYDGRHHTIHVSVDRPRVQLVYRLGYGADDTKQIEAKTPVPTKLASTTPDPGKNTMKASMARFAPPATQVVFDVKVAPTETRPGPTDAAVMGFPVDTVKGKPMVRYDILYTLPVEQIVFADGPGGTRNGSVEFDVVASDVFGKLITSVSRTMQFPLTAEEYAEFVKQPFEFLQQIDLPAGQVYVRVGVLDGVSKKVGTVEVPLTVAKGSGAVEAGR